MNREPEVLVIGAGVIGVAAAHALAERGRRVSVIDTGEVGRGGSYGNAGLTVPSHAVPLANPGALRNGLKWLLDPESPFYVQPRFDPALWSWLWRFRAASNEPQVARGLPVLRDLQKQLGFTLREFAVPPPAVEMRPQVLDIVRNYKADWVIAHLFGRAPGISIKELSRLRFPMNRIISFVWGGAEADINVAGWKTAQGYQSLQFAGVGQDHQIIRDIKKMYQDEGKAPPMDKMKISVFYNRGILIGAFHAEAIANAIKKHGNNITGEHTKEGFENIRNFAMGNFAPPVSVTPEDHEGGGWVQVWEVKGDKWVPASKWMAPYRDVVMKHVRATKYKK